MRNEMLQKLALAAHTAAYASRDEFLMPNWFKVAEAMLETLREVPEICYDQYKCDNVWAELDSTKVWNLWLDAIK